MAYFLWCELSRRGGIRSLPLSRLLASSKLAILWWGDTPLNAKTGLKK